MLRDGNIVIIVIENVSSSHKINMNATVILIRDNSDHEKKVIRISLLLEKCYSCEERKL